MSETTAAALRVLATDAQACALQRDNLRDRLDRIRAAAESDADLAKLPALRDFLLRETEPGCLHVPSSSEYRAAVRLANDLLVDIDEFKPDQGAVVNETTAAKLAEIEANVQFAKRPMAPREAVRLGRDADFLLALLRSRDEEAGKLREALREAERVIALCAADTTAADLRQDIEFLKAGYANAIESLARSVLQPLPDEREDWEAVHPDAIHRARAALSAADQDER